MKASTRLVNRLLEADDFDPRRHLRELSFWVIAGPLDDYNERLYWKDEEGWGPLDGASKYYRHEIQSLPIDATGLMELGTGKVEPLW